MTRARPAPFRKVDVTRAYRGAAEAGMLIGEVSIDQEGRIVIRAAGQPAEAGSDLDTWLAGKNARSA